MHKRWPIILTGIIDTIYHQDHALGVTLESETAVPDRSEVETKIKEGKAIIEQVSKLKYEMARDRPLECVDFCLSDIISGSPIYHQAYPGRRRALGTGV